MLTFEQIEKLIADCEPLPKYTEVEERCAYQELLVSEDLYRRSLILKQTKDKIRADIWHVFHDIRSARLNLRKSYEKQQEGIKAAESKLSELIKRVEPGADFEKLLLDAFEVIALLEGQETPVYDKMLRKKLYPETVSIIFSPADLAAVTK